MIYAITSSQEGALSAAVNSLQNIYLSAGYAIIISISRAQISAVIAEDLPRVHRRSVSSAEGSRQTG